MGKQIVTCCNDGSKQILKPMVSLEKPSSQNLGEILGIEFEFGESMMSENSDEDQFQCRYCEKVLYSARSLQIHEDRHTENLKYRCNFCQKTFPSQSSMTRHERTHTGEKEFPCTSCEAVGFREKKALLNHISKMHPMHNIATDNDTCDADEIANYVKNELEEFQIKNEPTDYNHTLDRRAFLISAESMKSSQNKQVNSAVGRTFPMSSPRYENTISTTKTEVGSSKEARFQCGYCDKSFATPSKVKRHILTHTGEKPFVCQFCSRGFSQKVHMMEHISKHHAEENLKAQQDAAASVPISAPAPILKPKSPQQYATQTLTGSPLINSSQSEVILPTSQSLSTSQVDSESVQIPIPENSYIVAEFSLKPADSHISPEFESTEIKTELDSEKTTEIMATIPYNHHSPLGSPSPVGYLSQKLRSPASPYSNHNTGFQSVTGPGERPYVCPHCSADFIRQSNLSVHMMKVHGEAIEIKTHQCSYCDKKFKYPNKRRLHEMTHTGEKPNVCQFCSMGFFKKSRLRVHLTKHHGISEAEVNNPSSTLFAPPQTAQTTQVQQSYYLSSRLPGEETEQIGDLFCQYCHKPFSTKAELLTHEQAEAMEFEQLHQIFEGNEFTGLGGDASQNDIIQNALLTAGIENGLTSPSVTDSDSVVTISEADINSFSIGFIPDSSWSSQDSQTLSQNSTPSTDPFYPTALSSDLTQGTEQSQVNQPTTQPEVQQTLTSSFVDITEPIKVENNPYPNMTGEINQLWETTEAPTSVSQNIISTTLNSIQTEPLLTSTQTDNFVSTSVGFNGIYTESTYTMSSDVTLPTDTLYTPVITQNQGIASLPTTTDVDFRSFTKLPTSTANYAAHGQQNYIDLDGLSTTTLVSAVTNGNAQNRITTTTGRTTEAWIDDPTLPAGWKTRQHFREQSPLSSGNKIDTYYMSPEGRQFRSKWRIVEFMEAAGTYCKEEIEWVKGAIQTPKPAEPLRGAVHQQPPKERSDKLKRNWKEDDPTVPKGWKIAWTTTSDNRSKIAFMSPDKRIFHSRKAAIQHMMQAGTYDPDDIVKMTSGLNVLLNVGKEWLTGDDTLPPGWKIRSHRWWCQKRNSYRIHYEFLSPQNEFFKSRKAVVEHMVQSGSYSQDEIEKVKAQNAPNQPEKNSKKKPSAISRQDLSPCNPLIGWKTGNNTLPPGWKIKRHEYANQTVYFYMSPKGDIIKSRRAVMDYMFDDGSYSETDFNAVISGAKQRKVALQEMYDFRTGTTKKKKRVRKFIPDEDKELDPVNEEQNNISECEEKENEEDIEGRSPKLEDKKSHKKQIVQKEIPMPTRRSRRFASRAEPEPKEDSDSEIDGIKKENIVPLDSASMEPEHKKTRIRQSKGKPTLSDDAVSESSPATSITELIDSPVVSGDGDTDMVDSLATEIEEDETIDFEEPRVELTNSMTNADVLQASLEEEIVDSKEGIMVSYHKQNIEGVQEMMGKVRDVHEMMEIVKEEKEEINHLPKTEMQEVVKTEIEQA